MEPAGKNFSAIKESYEKITSDDKITDRELANILKGNQQLHVRSHLTLLDTL